MFFTYVDCCVFNRVYINWTSLAVLFNAYALLSLFILSKVLISVKWSLGSWILSYTYFDILNFKFSLFWLTIGGHSSAPICGYSSSSKTWCLGIRTSQCSWTQRGATECFWISSLQRSTCRWGVSIFSVLCNLSLLFLWHQIIWLYFLAHKSLSMSLLIFGFCIFTHFLGITNILCLSLILSHSMHPSLGPTVLLPLAMVFNSSIVTFLQSCSVTKTVWSHCLISWEHTNIKDM